MTMNTRTQRRIDLRSLPIVVKLALALAIVLLISALFTDSAIRSTVTQAQQNVVLDDLETISRSNAFRLVSVMNEEIAALKSLTENNEIQGRILPPHAPAEGQVISGLVTDESLFQIVKEFRAANPEFLSVAVVDPLGSVRAIDPMPTGEVSQDLVNTKWFNRAFLVGEGGLFVSGPITDELSGIEGVHIAVPILNTIDSTKAIGVVYGIWDMSANIEDLTQVGNNRESLIVEPNGTVLLAVSDAQDSLPTDLAVRFLGAEAGTFHYTDAAGTQWLYGHENISDLTDNPTLAYLRWTIVVRQPVSSVQQTANQLSNRLRVVIGASGLIITMLIALFTYLLLLPLGRLTRAASRLQGGNLSAPIPVLPGDEVGRLADAMRGLVGQLVGRLGELRAAVQVSRAASLTLDINQMINDVARALTTQFNYPDVRVYLTDPTGRRANLQAASGAEGERLLRAAHRVPVDETTLVGRAMLLAETQSAVSGTTAEVAIPLLAGNRVLGGVHVTTRRSDGFRQEEIDILRLVTDQVSASIANAHLFEQSQASLAEIETLNRRLTREAWEEYVGQDGGMRHTLDPEQRWPAPLENIRQSAEPRAEVLTDADGRTVLAVPLVLRGEAVGSLAVTRPAGGRWSRDEVALMESVAARMSMIAEGIRLVDESNRRASREQRVNEVSANLLARATSVESVLRNALGELSTALGSDRVALRLGALPESDRQPSPGLEYREGKSLPSGTSNGDHDESGANRSMNTDGE